MSDATAGPLGYADSDVRANAAVARIIPDALARLREVLELGGLPVLPPGRVLLEVFVDWEGLRVSLAESITKITDWRAMTSKYDRDYVDKVVQGVRAEMALAVDVFFAKKDTALKTARADLERAVLPLRPATTDTAGQEAALANLRSDYRMALDPAGEKEVLDRLAELVASAAGRGDELAVWMLAASEWPRLYLTSRGGAARAEHWDAHRRHEVMVPNRTVVMEQATQLLGLLDGRQGVHAAVMAMRFVANVAVEDLVLIEVV